MNTISGLIPIAAQKPASINGDIKPPEVRQAEDKHAAPAQDEYSPAEKHEPIGRYWLGQDEEGQPKIYFDEPMPAKDASDMDEAADNAAGAPQEKAGAKKAEVCRGSTDKVDREIESLKKKKEALEQQIAAETDEAKIENLENKLKQVEGELRRKDNDAYRRSHMQVTGA